MNLGKELEILKRLKREMGLKAENNIPKRENTSEYPLSYAQERMWFAEEMNASSATYNVPLAMRILGPINILKLEEALNSIVQKHEVLRAHYKNEHGMPLQSITPYREVKIPVNNIEGATGQEKERRAKKVINKEAATPFNLAEGPLFRIKLYKISEENHILLLVFHHIVFDGWSTGILMEEFVTFYTEAEWSEKLDIQYADYAQWQRDRFDNGELETQSAYWREQLGDTVTTLMLPTDNIVDKFKRAQGNIKRFEIEKSIITAIKEISKKYKVSSFTIFIAAYYVFLYKYTNQKELILGVPVANRQHMDIEKLIGCITNTIPLKALIDTQQESIEFIQEISETIRLGQNHEEFPFDKLVDLLSAARDLNSNPIFQTMFVYQQKEKVSFHLDGCDFLPYEVETHTSKFDLSLSILDTPDRIDAFFEYSTAFDDSTIDRMITSYILILSEMVQSPNRHLAEISAAADLNKSSLVEKQTFFSKTGNIQGKFIEQAMKYPHQTAVICGDERITYAQLEQQSNKLANYLIKNGVQNEAKVALHLDRSIPYIVSILAVLKAGGIYIPLDPEQPESRLRYIINDSKCDILLTQTKYKGNLDIGEKCRSIIWEEDPWNMEGSAGSLLEVHPDQVAYIIYTSGSTGKPKGVLNTHHNVRRLFHSAEEHFTFLESDVWTLFHSLAFDFTVWEIWGALFYGGKLIIVPSNVRRNPSEFKELLIQQDVTVLNQTPSAFKELLNEFKNTPIKTNLKYIIFGGEALSFDDLTSWFEMFGDKTQIINMYGITETTVHVTWREVSANDTRNVSKSLIGTPLNDLNINILNEEFEPVPIGVKGEIYVSGDGLAHGYHERYALTAERFVPNPFTADGGRLYRTGDVGRFLPGGDIEYSGRIDDQVKIKGHRIELGEIKSFISSVPSVRDCELAVKINKNNEKELAAFIVFNEGNDQKDLKELRKSLLQGLPRYMFPAHLHSVESIPVTANGKADKTSLLKICEENEAERGKQPVTKTEKTLAEIWQQVLNKDQVYLQDNFFSLGGDSIRCLKVISKAEELGYLLTLEDLFQNQTIEDLVSLLSEPGRNINSHSALEPFALIPINQRTHIPKGIEDAYPLAKVQEGMFFHMEQYPDQPLYHNIDSILLKGKFNYALFMEAVSIITKNNIMLRTSFDLRNFLVPVQLVHSEAELPVKYMDIRNLSYQEQEAIIDQYVQQEKMNRFDLSKPGLLRFFVHQRTDDTFQFSLTECHLIFDGWSLTSTLADIFETYFQLLEGTHLQNASKLEIDYKDFIFLERKAMESEEHIQFWKGFLEECQVLNLPIFEEKRRQKTPFKVRRRIIELSHSTSRNLKKISEEYKMPVKSILLASHIKALQSITGQSDVLTGMVSNGRMEKKDGEKVKGLFINTLPFRQQVSPGSWLDHISATFGIEQRIMPYRRLPLPEIQRHINQTALFDTAFNYVYFHSMEPLMTSDKIQVLDYNSHSANDTHFKLMVTFSNHPPDYEIRLTLAYDESTFTEMQMDMIERIYRNILEAIAENPIVQHTEHSYLPEQIYEKVISDWNSNHEKYEDEELGLHELIQNQDGSRLALIEGTEEYSYEWLNQASDKVAAFLQSKDIRNNLVGIYMDRSAEMIAALVGILKSGCAYVPLDTSYPEERIRYMLTDSTVAATLTTRKRLKDLEEMTDNCINVEDVLNDSISPVNPERSVPAIAYMIYTSGSTGRPKGTIVEHRGVVNRILWMQKHYGITKDEVGLHKTPLSFDYSVFEIFSTLCTGGALVLAGPEGHKDSRYLAELIQTHKVTTLFFVPTMLQEFLKTPEVSAITSINRVMCSGEPLTPQVKNAFYQMFDAKLFNQYGPTEASVEVTSFSCTKEQDIIRIGKPMANTKIYILDQNMQPVGIGAAAEIYIGGIGLAAAYHGKRALTADSFIPDPYSIKGERLYKTGDIARYTPDGEIEYISRKDNQVKMRGLRIELSEIESIIREQNEFEDGIVTYQKDDHSPDGVLIAYIIPKNKDQITENNAKKIMRKALPRYMVPERIVLMEELPVNPNGKLDRKKLPIPLLEREERDIKPPSTILERKLAAIYQQVLGLDQVGINEDFFELGGNSLNVVHLMGQAEKVLGQKIPIDLIYEKPTIHEILEEIVMQSTIIGKVHALAKGELHSMQGEWLTELTERGDTIFIIPEMEAVYATYPIPQALDIIEEVASEYRFIAIQPPSIVSGAEENIDRMNELSNEHWLQQFDLENLKITGKLFTEELKKHQPRGPYRICAHSTGLLLALEIAKHLEESGEELDILVFPNMDTVSDTDCPNNEKEKFIESLLSFSKNTRNLYELPEGDIWEILWEILLLEKVISTEVSPEDLYNMFLLEKANINLKQQFWKRCFDYKVKANLHVISPVTVEPSLWTRMTEGEVVINTAAENDTDLSTPHIKAFLSRLKTSNIELMR
ncbi:non-ribosomal peptide synthetase [Bacillus infantis]|uniref:Amino acid adenylation domain-containing protein n=1 Tax=Bacillus infantis TaxID=324767 RepID=A0A5D4RL75_9BACI|nr:non-ribosomal peptide synthetase [Bacillus infantis]TYS51131.1 amino acid adenylation domain-containing protein [Bacillus infantis]